MVEAEGRGEGGDRRELMVRGHHGLEGWALHEPAHGSEDPATEDNIS